MAATIEVRDLSHTYSAGTPFQHDAVKHMSFSVEKGEFLGIIGHTGSGKSTLIQHLNGLLYPEYQLFEETVYRDIAFGPKNMSLSEEEIRTRVLRAAGFAGVDESLLGKSPFDLSGGQKRRVAIAGVIAMEPEVVIFDEPTAGLDPAGCASILGNIRDYQKASHATILMVTHSMDEVAQLADRMLVLNEGTIEMSGTPREVFSHAARLAEIGLSVPQVTALFLRLRELGVDVDPTTFTVEQAVPQLRALLEGRAHA